MFTHHWPESVYHVLTGSNHAQYVLREKKKEKMLMIDEWYSGRCNNNGAVRLLLQKMATKTRFACCVLGIIFGHVLLSVCIWLFSTSNKSKEEEFQVKAHKRPADLKV